MSQKIPYIQLLGLGLVIGINVYFRSFPINFPQLAQAARERVESRLYQKSAEFIEKDNANLSQMAKESLVKFAAHEYKRNNRQKIEDDTAAEYQSLKDKFQDKEGQTYLFELDCWHWARYVENTVRTGHPGDAVVNGVQRDLLMNHPAGMKVYYNMLLYYVSAFLYKAARLIIDVPLYTFLFYLPLFFIVLFIGALYLICWRFYGAFAAAICCLFVGLSPIFIPRSCAGWFDMDILNLLFPFLVVCSYLMSYGRQKAKVRFLWLALASILVGLFAYTWMFWWFVVGLIFLYEVYSLLDLLFEWLQYRTAIRSAALRHIFSLCCFVPMSVLSVLIFAGPDPLSIMFTQLKNALSLNDPVNSSVWPNVLSTVGELSRPSILRISEFIGNPFLFLLSLICMLMLVLRNKLYRGVKRESIMLFVLWFIVMFTACYQGTRFIVFLLIPMGVFLGWGVREAFNYCVRRRKKKKFLLPVFGLLVVMLLGTFLSNGRRVAIGLYPMMDDSWYKVLTNLKNNTPPDAALNSWWDFGDWFKAVANRSVIFDGQSQTMPQGYWMAKVLLSDSESSAMAILRMLNNGGNQAFETIEKHLHDPFRSIALLERVLYENPENGRKILDDNLPGNAAKVVARILYNRPTSAYFIVDYTLIGKMYPISYLGNWDAARLYVVKHINSRSKEEIIAGLVSMGKSEESAFRLYRDARLLSPKQYDQWISHRARFISGLIPGKTQGDIVLFDNGLVYSTKDSRMFALNGYDGKYSIPKSMFYVKNGQLQEHVFPDATLDFSVLLLEDKDGYQAVQLDRELGRSLFTKLYFLKGKGLRNFKPFTDNGDPNNYIGVFEIDWAAYERE
jgi:dolichyl-phosphooligosaccharide-protein glycotransferase